VEKYGTATDDNIIWRMHVACCITKATHSQSEYIILFFPAATVGARSRPDIALYLLCLSREMNSPGSEESNMKALTRLRTQLHRLIVAVSDDCNLIQNWPAAASSRR